MPCDLCIKLQLAWVEFTVELALKGVLCTRLASKGFLMSGGRGGEGGILGMGVLLGSPNNVPILTAYIIGASRNLSYILQILPCSASPERV